MKQKQKDLTDIIKDENVEICKGCDEPSLNGSYDKGKYYCPRCYEEVIALRDYHSKENKNRKI
jgi:predicted RNA-binding Zn-ribbon protein involved in translation (DUF1610 family)